jgi:hypothetical protein
LWRLFIMFCFYHEDRLSLFAYSIRFTVYSIVSCVYPILSCMNPIVSFFTSRLIDYLRFYVPLVPLKYISLIWTRHLLQNLGLCSALRAFEQGGILIVPHLLWHGTSVFPASSEGPPYLVASYDTRGDVKDLFWPGSSRGYHVKNNVAGTVYQEASKLIWSFLAQWFLKKK